MKVGSSTQIASSIIFKIVALNYIFLVEELPNKMG